MSSAQPVSVISLILHCVSASDGHLQVSSVKYIKGIMYSCIKFEMRSRLYSLIKYMSLCYTNYIQRKVKWLKWFNDSQTFTELYRRILT